MKIHHRSRAWKRQLAGVVAAVLLLQHSCAWLSTPAPDSFTRTRFRRSSPRRRVETTAATPAPVSALFSTSTPRPATTTPWKNQTTDELASSLTVSQRLMEVKSATEALNNGNHKAADTTIFDLPKEHNKDDADEKHKTLPGSPPSKHSRLYKLRGKLLKQTRALCNMYDMLQDGDHIMVCVSGGKDSASLLYLLKHLQQTLPVSFRITAVHVDQGQPGYNGTSLEAWLRDELQVEYRIIRDDTYSIVVDKTAPGQSYCTLCSRLRRGVLYTAAAQLQCNKMALGHHADDALETLLLNMIHAGQIKAMPARYQTTAREGFVSSVLSSSDKESSHATKNVSSLAVLRPLLRCLEDDLAEFARLQQFPILPCNLCSNQANLQRPQVKLLLQTIQDTLNPNAKANMLHALQTVRPSHLLDQDLRRACGMDPVTGELMAVNDTDDAV